MFNGHQLYKVGDCWVFDLTEFICYKVEKNGETIQKADRAFKVNKSKDHTEYEFDKYMSIPLGILRKSKIIIEAYIKDALLVA